MMIAVFTKNRTNPAYEAARLGADRAAKWLGAQTTHFVPDKGDDPEEQSLLVEQALAMKPDAFVFSPVHPTRVNNTIEKINMAGIPLFAFVNPIPVGRCISYVGADDYRLGFRIAGHLYDYLKGDGRVLIVSGPEISVTSIERVRAFRNAARDYPGITIVGTCVGEYLRETARKSVAQWLQTNSVPDGCVVANDIMAIGVIEALRTVGQKSAVVGVNAIPGAIDAIKAGDMLATADFNAMHMAFLATECAIRYLRGEAVPSNIELPVTIVDRHNLDLWDLPYEKRTLATLKEIIPP